MKTRTTRGLPRPAVAASLLLLALAAGGAGVLVRRANGVVEYEPPAGLPRLRADTIRLPATASLIDFDGTSSDLYFLDGMTRDFVHVRRTASEWLLHGIHAERGAGPGKLRSPRSLTVVSDSVVVISDLDELEFFTRDGVYSRTVRPELPCPAPVVDLASADGFLFGSANCIRGDTMAATLFRYHGRGPATRIRDEPRMSLSGRWGSMFVALRSIGDDAHGVSFGTGRTPCVIRQPAAVSARRECWPLTPYRADAPADFLRTTGPAAWPDTLPYYVDRAGSASGRMFLVRPFSADSAVITAADEIGGKALMVVPLSAMIGCRASGCAWTADLPNQTLILLVPLSRLDSIAEAK